MDRKTQISSFAPLAWFCLLVGAPIAAWGVLLPLGDFDASSKYIHDVTPQRLPWLFGGLMAALVAGASARYLTQKHGNVEGIDGLKVAVGCMVFAGLWILWVLFNPCGYVPTYAQ